jgi:hypothetical protein
MVTTPANLVAVTSALILDVAVTSPAPATHGPARRLRPYAQFTRPIDLGLGALTAGPAFPHGPAGRFAPRAEYGADGVKGAGAAGGGSGARDGGCAAWDAGGASGGGAMAGDWGGSGDGEGAAAAGADAGVGAVAYAESGGVAAFTEVECEVRRLRALKMLLCLQLVLPHLRSGVYRGGVRGEAAMVWGLGRDFGTGQARWRREAAPAQSRPTMGGAQIR